MTAPRDFYDCYGGSKSPDNSVISSNISLEPGGRKDRGTHIAEIYMRGGKVYLFQEAGSRYSPFASQPFQGERGKAIIAPFHNFYMQNKSDTRKLYLKFSPGKA